MLGLSTHFPKFYILREDLYDINNKYFVININNSALQLGEIMRWETDNCNNYDVKNAIDDFIFLCFMAGNDFLPHIPSIEILESGLEIILSIYRTIGSSHGHIIKNTKDNAMFNKNVLKVFFEMISQYEQPTLEKKLKNKGIYFKDDILEKCTTFDKEITLDIEKYRKEYSEYCFGKGEKQLKKICHDYLDGLQWVITYYKKGCNNWKYYYPYDYSPSASILAKYIDTFNNLNMNEKNVPFSLFQQLISILPPKSSKLLPNPLNKLLTDEDSLLKEYCPDKFEIDLAGKKREYQGIVKLPMIQPELIIKSYISSINLVDEKELRRNAIGKSFIYTYSQTTSILFNSFYGKILNCKVKTNIIYI
jgi:5'-3' exonuclease